MFKENYSKYINCINAKWKMDSDQWQQNWYLFKIFYRNVWLNENKYIFVNPTPCSRECNNVGSPCLRTSSWPWWPPGSACPGRGWRRGCCTSAERPRSRSCATGRRFPPSRCRRAASAAAAATSSWCPGWWTWWRSGARPATWTALGCYTLSFVL